MAKKPNYRPYSLEDFANDDLASSIANYGRAPEIAEEPQAKEEQGDFMRGLSNYIPQMKEMGNSIETLAGVGAKKIGLDAVGDYIIKSGLEGLGEAKKQIKSHKSDSFSNAWDEGLGTVLADWLPYQMGQTVGNVGEGLAAMGAGAVVGAAATGPAAPAGAVGGAAGGLVGGILFKSLLKKGVIDAAKELADKEGEQVARDYLKKQAMTLAGTNAAMASQAIYHGFGETGSRVLEEAQKNGVPLDQIDLGRYAASATGHAALEFIGDKILMGGVFGDQAYKAAGKGVAPFAKTVGGNVLKTGAKEMPVEMAQTGLERFGAGLDLTDAEARREYVDAAAAAGAMGVAGAPGGVRTYMAPDPVAPVNPIDPLDAQLQAQIDQGNSPLSRAAAATRPAAEPPMGPNFDPEMGVATDQALPDPLAAEQQPLNELAQQADPALQDLEIAEPIAETLATQPISQITQWQTELEQAEPFSEAHTTLIERLQPAVLQDAQASVESGLAPVYQVADGQFVVLHPSAQNEGMVQVTRYTPEGIIGDTQYPGLAEAVQAEALWQAPRLAPEAAESAVGQSLLAEAGYQARTQVSPPQGNANELAPIKAIEAESSTPTQAAASTTSAAEVSPGGPAPLVGEPINGTWTAFHPESGTLNVPRKQMPQIKSEHRGAMVTFLKARGIEGAEESVAAETLKPTQAEFSPVKVKKAIEHKGGDRPVLVSADGYVLDGHHQWLAKAQQDAPVKITRLAAPIKDLLSVMREFPSAGMAKDAARDGRKRVEAPQAVAAPLSPSNPGNEGMRTRRAQLQAMAADGFTQIESDALGHRLVNPERNEEVLLGSSFDAHLAKQAVALYAAGQTTGANNDGAGNQAGNSGAQGVDGESQSRAALRDTELERLVQDQGAARDVAADGAYVAALEAQERDSKPGQTLSIKLADPASPKTQAVNRFLDLFAAITGKRGIAVEWTGEASADGAQWGERFVVDVSNPSMSVAHTLAHEFKHLTEQHPELRAAFARLYALIPNQVKKDYVRKYLLRSGQPLAALTPAQLLKMELEITADFMGEMLTDKQWLSELALKKPALFGAFIGKWIEALDSLIGKLKSLAGLGNANSQKQVASRFKDAAGMSEKLLADLQEARQLAMEVVELWATQRPAFAEKAGLVEDDVQYAKRAGPMERVPNEQFLVPQIDGAFADGAIAVMPALRVMRGERELNFASMPVRVRVGQHGRGAKSEQFGAQHRMDHAADTHGRGFTSPAIGDSGESRVERAVRDIASAVLNASVVYADKKISTAVVVWSPETRQSVVLEREVDTEGVAFWSVKTVIPKESSVMTASYGVPAPIKGITLDGIDSQLSNAVVRGMLNKLRAPVTFLGDRDSYTVSDAGLIVNGQTVLPAEPVANVPKKPLTRDANGKIILNKNKVQASARDVTETPEFRAWFGESKVVGRNGRPLVMYHGAKTGDITEFGPATYFSEDASEASDYSVARGANSAVYPVFIRIENPYEASDESDDENRSELTGIDEDYANELAAAGYDGVVSRRNGVTLWAIPFSPVQIRSTIGNNGDFDGANLGISKSAREQADLQDELNDELQVELSGADLPQADVSDGDIKAKGLMAEAAFDAQVWSKTKSRPGDMIETTVEGLRGPGKGGKIYMEEMDGLWGVGLPTSWVGPAAAERDGYASKKAVQAFVQRQVAAIDLHERKFDLVSTLKPGQQQRLLDAWDTLAAVEPAPVTKPGRDGQPAEQMVGPFKYDKVSPKSMSLQEIASDLGISRDYTLEVHREVQDPTFTSIQIAFKNKASGEVNEANLDLHKINGMRYLSANTISMGKGGLGTAFYQLAAEYAARNKLMLRPEAQLSGINSYRRTEQQLSAALRTGRSTVMVAHPTQRVYGFDEKAATQAQHQANVTRLLLAGLRNARELFPKLDTLRYHPQTDRFTNAAGADQGAKVDAALKTIDARAFGLGRSTLARAVLTNMVLREQLDASEVQGFYAPILYSARETAQAEYAAVEAQYRGTEGWLKAPNGEPTLLNERQWIQVRTPSFQRWFGPWELYAKAESGVWSDDQGAVSKAVDANGEPLVVYHGTDKGGFAEFAEPGGSGRGDLGIFATDHLDMARSYVRRNRSRMLDADDIQDVDSDDGDFTTKPGVYAAFMNIRNPNEENFEGALWSGSREHQWVVEVGGETQADADGKQYFDSKAEAAEFAKTFVAEDDEEGDPLDYVRGAEDHWASTDDVVREGRRDGHDGAIIREVIDDGGGPGYDMTPSDVFVALKPNQLKSADFNTGEFGRTDDIRYSKRLPEGLNPRVALEVAGVARIAQYLTPEERAKLRKDTAKKLVDIYAVLPSSDDMAAAAYAGKAKRGWYRHSREGLDHIFGPDAWRFTALLAALSPQCSVEINLENALNTWKNWTAAGRPTERAAIVSIMGQSVQGDKGEDSVLNSWINNVERALTAEQFEGLVLSGPKVDSFMRNLMGDLLAVTNDAWMANYALVDQFLFSGSLNKAGTEPGKGPGYLAMNAAARKAAQTLGWQPAEVQETVWSWAMSLLEMMDAKGEARGAIELMNDGELSDEVIGKTKDFRILFHEPRYAAILQAAGYSEQLNSLSAPAQHEDNGPAPFNDAKMGKLLTQAGLRLEFLQRQRRTNVQISWEARPGESTGILAGMRSAPLALQQQYLADVFAAIETTGFKDATGLSLRNTLFGPSAWQGKVLAGAQSLTRPGIVADNKGGLMVDPESRRKIAIAASALGIALNQEGVYWHYPIYKGGQPKDENGAEMIFGRSLTTEEMSRLYQIITKKAGHDMWAPANTPTGVRLLNFTETGNLQFYKTAKASLAEFVKKFDGHGDIKRFSSDGDAIENNWKENPDGHVYRSRISEAGRPDLLKWVDGELQAAVDAVNRRYSTEHGWGAATRGELQRSAREPGRPDAGVHRGGDSADQRVPPRYGQPIAGASSAVGYHFSPQGRTGLSSAYYGSGLKGAEAARLSGSVNNDIRPRVFFYVDKGNGVRAEQGVGAYGHHVRLDNVYDVFVDDLGIVKRNPGANNWERAILEAGFDGYLSNDPIMPQAFVVLVGQQHANAPVAQTQAPGAKPNPVVEKPVDARATTVEGDELVRKPDAAQMLALAHPERRAKVKAAAPSFRLQYGAFRVLKTESAAADAAMAEFSPSFKFGAVQMSARDEALEFREDIPNENWLQSKINYAASRPRNSFGVPVMQSVTGYFSKTVQMPVRWATQVKGERAEQVNVRPKDLAAIRKIMRSTGKLPLTNSGKEYAPYIEIGYDGQPWVNEGNHRIMAAELEGWKYIPVEVRYFDGGQRRAGKFAPDNLLEITERVNAEQTPAADISKSAREPSDLFFSELSRQIEKSTMKQAPAGAWQAFIKALDKKGVKSDEIEFSGVNDWLQLQDSKVSKEALLDYLAANGVQVQEVVLGGEGAADGVFSDYSDDDIAVEADGDKFHAYLGEEDLGRFNTHEEALGAARNLLDSAQETLPTKYHQHTLPGGTNYREVLLTLPLKPRQSINDFKDRMVNKYGQGLSSSEAVELASLRGRGGDYMSNEDMERLADLENKEDSIDAWKQSASPEDMKAYRELQEVEQREAESTYQSSHWDQANVLAHLRLNDRVDAEGNKVLFVEEIQSDWGQQAKKDGIVATKYTTINALNGRITEYDTQAQAKAAASAPGTALQFREMKTGGVPDAPFISNTQGWLNLTLKRVLGLAVDGGYAKVAFVTGEQSADRYDLSKQVDMLSMDSGYPSGYNITAWKSDRELTSKKVNDEAEAADMVGKDVARKLFAQLKPNQQHVELSGLDLKVGGEGMKSFYNSIVPNAVKALLKKLGGTQMETVEISQDHDASNNSQKEWDESAARTLLRRGAEVYLVDSGNETRIKTETQLDEELEFGAPDGYVLGDNQGSSEQPGFAITPDLRARVEQGMPLFSQRDLGDTLSWTEFAEHLAGMPLRDGFGKMSLADKKQMAAAGSRWSLMSIDPATLAPTSGQPSTKAPVVIGQDGDVLDGRHRLASAVARGDASIAAWVASESVQRSQRDHQSNFEVAPDPNDAALSAEWNALSLGAKLSISRRVADAIIPKILKTHNATGQIVEQIGSYPGDTNPSFALQTDSPDVDQISRDVGYVLSQDAMTNMSLAPFPGSEQAGAVLVSLGPKTFDEVKQVYDQLRAAIPQVSGQSYVDGVMYILNVKDWTGLDTTDLMGQIDAVIGNQYDVSTKDFYYSFPEKKDYNYDDRQAIRSGDGSEDSEAVWQARRALRTEASALIREEIDRAQGDPAQEAQLSQRDQTETAAFKRWFDDSKVVDSEGRPLMVYHGTRKNFAVFHANSWFAADPTHANSYSTNSNDRYGSGSKVLPVYLALQNPLDLTNISLDDWFDAGEFDHLAGFAAEGLGWEMVNSVEFSEAAKKAGYDGVVANEAHPSTGKDSLAFKAFQPTQIKSATGNSGVFDPSNPDIRKSRREFVGRTTRQYTPEQIAAFGRVGFEVEIPSLKDRAKALWKDAGKKLAQGIVDQFAPVKELSPQAYGLLRLAKGASGAFEALLKGGKLKLSDGVYDFDETQRGGVIDTLLKPMQGEHHDFLRWVAASRAERLIGEGKENLFTPADIAAIKTLQDGTLVFDYTLQHGPRAGQTTRNRPEMYADSLITFNAFNENVMDLAEQSGLIDGDARAMWEHEFYVPFYRVSEENGFAGATLKGGSVRQVAFQKLKGGTDVLNADLLDNTLMNWAHLLDASAKNRAAKATLEAAEAAGVAVSASEETARQMGRATDNRNGVVWFMDDGKQHYYLVDDPFVLQAITSLEYAGMRNPMMNAMGAVKRALTIGVTASPFFKIRNLIRDSVQVIGTSGISANVAKNIKDGWALTDPKNDMYFRMLAGGGTIHFGTMLEGSEAKRVQALVESGVDAATILNDEHKIKAFYRKFIEPGITAYNELGNRGETINRAALYKQLVGQGASHADASLQARDLMDFSMQGTFTTVRFLTQVVPFLNARLQGMYKLGRAAHEDPKRMAYVTGAVALASLGLLAAFGDDEDWKKRENWDRNNFWWFKFGGTAFRIPKPFEIGAIGTLAERSAELLFTKEMTGARFGEQILMLLGDNLAMNPVPQLVKPMLEIYANKNSFSGRPIETLSMERLQPEYRFTANTSMTARAMSTGLNAAAGVIGKESLSPVQIDSLIRGYFGWLGTFIVGSADIAARFAVTEPTRPATDIWKTATGGIVANLDDAPSRYVSQVYDQAREIEQAYGTWRSLLKEGKTEEAREFRADNADKLNRHKNVAAIKGAISKINQQIRAVERGALDKEAKRAEIRRLNARKEQFAQRLAA